LNNTKLILIEGLPGSGKSTTAQLTNEILNEMNIDTELFLEGNFEHPADYQAVSYFTASEFTDLIAHYKEFESLIISCTIKRKDDYLLLRNKLREKKLPDEFLSKIRKNDIYELPLELHIELITEKWEQFRDDALNGNKIFIFDCSFIQNPVTIGMIKYGASNVVVINFIMRLAEIIESLNPILIYVDQADIERSFKLAIETRPGEWFNGFMDYYNNQAFGKKLHAKGIEGTLAILKARNQLESQIFEGLEMSKIKIDNSKFEKEKYKTRLIEILQDAFFSVENPRTK